jgi:hypothetical protein
VVVQPSNPLTPPPPPIPTQPSQQTQLLQPSSFISGTAGAPELLLNAAEFPNVYQFYDDTSLQPVIDFLATTSPNKTRLREINQLTNPDDVRKPLQQYLDYVRNMDLTGWDTRLVLFLSKTPQEAVALENATNDDRESQKLTKIINLQNEHPELASSLEAVFQLTPEQTINLVQILSQAASSADPLEAFPQNFFIPEPQRLQMFVTALNSILALPSDLLITALTSSLAHAANLAQNPIPVFKIIPVVEEVIVSNTIQPAVNPIAIPIPIPTMEVQRQFAAQYPKIAQFADTFEDAWDYLISSDVPLLEKINQINSDNDVQKALNNVELYLDNRDATHFDERLFLFVTPRGSSRLNYQNLIQNGNQAGILQSKEKQIRNEFGSERYSATRWITDLSASQTIDVVDDVRDRAIHRSAEIIGMLNSTSGIYDFSDITDIPRAEKKDMLISSILEKKPELLDDPVPVYRTPRRISLDNRELEKVYNKYSDVIDLFGANDPDPEKLWTIPGLNAQQLDQILREARNRYQKIDRNVFMFLLNPAEIQYNLWLLDDPQRKAEDWKLRKLAQIETLIVQDALSELIDLHDFRYVLDFTSDPSREMFFRNIIKRLLTEFDPQSNFPSTVRLNEAPNFNHLDLKLRLLSLAVAEMKTGQPQSVLSDPLLTRYKNSSVYSLVVPQPSPSRSAQEQQDLYFPCSSIQLVQDFEKDSSLTNSWVLARKEAGQQQQSVYINLITLECSLVVPLPQTGAYITDPNLPRLEDITRLSGNLQAFESKHFFDSFAETVERNPAPFAKISDDDDQDPVTNACVLFVKHLVRKISELTGIDGNDPKGPGSNLSLQDKLRMFTKPREWMEKYQLNRSNESLMLWLAPHLIPQNSSNQPALASLFTVQTSPLYKDSLEFATLFYHLFVACALCYPEVFLPCYTVGRLVRYNRDNHYVALHTNLFSTRKIVRIVFPGIVTRKGRKQVHQSFVAK